ncbi:MAG: hypothetical protein NTW03_00190, partial [Verrucomicrobia bacterium]|nr:hypothetical protein [Verrucomicrobiota bacterium]
WEGAMAAMAVIPVGDAFEAGYQGLRGISAGFGRAAAVGDRIGGFAEFLAAKGVDFMAAGRLGGGLYDAGKLGQLEGYLGRRGVTLQVGDEFLPAGKVGGFNAAEGTLSLRSNPTQYEVWHELSHFRQFQQLGPEAYMSQSLVQKEQFVFDLLNNSPRRWDALNFDQQQHAIQYILEKGGMR